MRKLTQVYLSCDRDSLPWEDPRRPAFLVADHVLAGHFYARLYVALRHEGGDTYGVGTSDGGDVVPGIYAASTFTRVSNAASIEEKFRESMRVFGERGITEQERANAVGYLTGHLAFGRQAPDQILARWLTERRFGLAPGTLDDLVDRASTLSLEEINAFIRDFYDPAQFTMIRALPE
jgi:predicted Zn-dependent peptidase